MLSLKILDWWLCIANFCLELPLWRIFVNDHGFLYLSSLWILTIWYFLPLVYFWRNYMIHLFYPIFEISSLVVSSTSWLPQKKVLGLYFLKLKCLTDDYNGAFCSITNLSLFWNFMHFKIILVFPERYFSFSCWIFYYPLFSSALHKFGKTFLQ